MSAGSIDGKRLANGLKWLFSRFAHRRRCCAAPPAVSNKGDMVCHARMSRGGLPVAGKILQPPINRWRMCGRSMIILATARGCWRPINESEEHKNQLQRFFDGRWARVAPRGFGRAQDRPDARPANLHFTRWQGGGGETLNLSVSARLLRIMSWS